MSIESTYISNDLQKDDRQLSFNVKNAIKYDFTYSRGDDKIIMPLNNADEPVAVEAGNKESLRDRTRSNGKLIKVFDENLTVEVYGDGDSSPFHTKEINVEYYMQEVDIVIDDDRDDRDGGGEIVDGGRGDQFDDDRTRDDGGTSSGDTRTRDDGGTTSGGSLDRFEIEDDRLRLDNETMLRL